MINKDLIFRRSLIEFDEKDIEHIYKYDDINIYIRKSIDENDKNKVTLDDDYLKLNSDELLEYRKVKWLSLLVEFWKKKLIYMDILILLILSLIILELETKESINIRTY